MDKDTVVLADAGVAPGQVFYQFLGPDHRPVITNDLATVPPDLRPKANVVIMNPQQQPTGLFSKIDETSLGAGAALGLIAGVLLSRLTRNAPRVATYAGAAAVVVLGFLAYFGWLRRTAGLDQGVVATPQALIDDAKNAVNKMNAKMREEDRQLKEIQDESKH